MIKSLVKSFVPIFLLDFYHYMMALLGAIVFGFPSRKITVIGVTGTSGKSTTVDFIVRIFEEVGCKTASFSSIRFKIGQNEQQNNLKMTMPGRLTIQKFLRQAVSEKCEYAVIEVTSEGIKQHRHRFIKFKAAVFTNLSPEHIESHGSFENYRNEKLKLFKAAKGIHIINIDDENAHYFLDILSEKKYVFTAKKMGANNQWNLIKAEKIKSNKNGLHFKVKDVNFFLPLAGDFNIYNALAAISTALAFGIDLKLSKKALEKISLVPGRMEFVVKKPFQVIIDYAHTPNQLELVYKSLAGVELICVLGSCGGGRDKWKRPVLGQIAQKYCRKIIITNEDPYDENPLEIMKQIAEGINVKKRTVNYSIIPERQEAIKKALSLAKHNQAVIITGKGSESLMCLANGKKVPWSDKEIVKKIMQT